MRSKEILFKATSICLGITAAALVGLIALLIHIQLARLIGENVNEIIQHSSLARAMFLDPNFRLLRKAIIKNRANESYFFTVVNFDQKVPLPESMFLATKMFGFERYRFRPNVNNYVCRAWSGLAFQGLILPATEEIKQLSSKADAQCFGYETDHNGFKPTGLAEISNPVTIFFLGDSFTEGMWVAPEKTFVSQFGQKFRSLGLPVTPINLGVRGYGALEEDWMLEQFAPLLNPNLVFLNMVPNDVIADDKLAIMGRVPEENYKVMFSYLQRIQDYCESHDIKLVVTVIPEASQFKELRGLSAFRDRVKAWSDVRHILFLDPRKYFDQVGPTKLYLTWDGHFSEDGHVQYANFLYEHAHSLVFDAIKSRPLSEIGHTQ